QEGPGWFADWNPEVKCTLDVDLMHTFIHSEAVFCVRFSHDGKYFATGHSTSVRIYDVGTAHSVLEHDTKHDTTPPSACFSPDDKYLVTCGYHENIFLWNIAEKSVRSVCRNSKGPFFLLAFSPNGKFLVSGSRSGIVQIWDVEVKSDGSLSEFAGPYRVYLDCIAISPDSQLVATGCSDAIRIWDINTGQLVKRLRYPSNRYCPVAFTPDGKGLVSGSSDRTLKYWDIRNVPRGGPEMREALIDDNEGEEEGTRCNMTFLGHTDVVTSVAVSPDGEWILSGYFNDTVKLWDARTATLQLTLRGHNSGGRLQYIVSWEDS
ncbi:WD40 repeat-like protein, partial [Punctularia strigosozonata HHB-11173 SS5]|uniref:WD40 repeat-like protein n=1 Tax=Punctularia strigosozonata (strain HHB-11173) TaxID=741275 RepID=UPI0004417E0E